MSEPISSVRGRAVHLPGDDIDTDRLVPARFLKVLTFDDLGAALMFDERHDAEGRPVAHPLNHPEAAGATVLVAGANFGCGSSREHAPQAIRRAGFRAVLARSFAEIFAGNAGMLGIVCATLPADTARVLADHPSAELEVDVARSVVRVDGAPHPIELEPAHRRALLDGTWDPLTGLLEASQAVRGRLETLPYTGW